MESQRCCFNASRNNSTDQSSAIFLTEDLIVAEILPRLHVKALFRFKCVSVRYKSIISDPKFGQKYQQRAYSSQVSCSSSGLLASLLYPFMNEVKPRAFTANVKDLSETVNLSSHNQYPNDEDKLSTCLFTASLSCEHVNHLILCSSGGLQLSFASFASLVAPRPDFRDLITCVSNPLTKQCVQIPEPTTIAHVGGADVFGFATRWDDAAASLTYKVVIFLEEANGPNTIHVFSSDTGSWVVWKVIFPNYFFQDGFSKLCCTRKGVLHRLDRRHGCIITYNPYDTPDRVRCYMLPRGKYSGWKGQKITRHKSLIYSGEEEKLKYCEIGKCKSEPGVSRLMVWRLEEYDDGKWCLEGEFSVPSFKYGCDIFMVAPYPWNRRVICHVYVKSNTIIVHNPWDGTWKRVDIFKYAKKNVQLYRPFQLAELCPWSSPLHAASPTNLL